MSKSSDINKAIQHIKDIFPFDNYMITDEKYYSEASTVMKYLEPGSSILDFGCGPMDVNGILQVLGYNCTGYDDLGDVWHKVPENRRKIFDYIESLGMTLTIASDEGFPYEKNSFDMFMTHDVMEHLHNSPKDILINGLEMTKPGGLIYVSMPSAVNIKKRLNVMRGITNHPPFDQYYWYPSPWRGHVREYSRKDLEMLAEYLEVEVLEIRAVDHMLEKVSPGFRTIYKGITAIFQDWKDSYQLVARKPTNWNPKRELSRDEIDKMMGHRE